MKNKNKIKKQEENIDSDIKIETEDLNIQKTEELKTENLEKLIEKNIKWSQVIYNQNKKIKHRLTMMVIGNYVRLFLILIPLIIGLIYLPDFIEAYFEKYAWIFNTENSGAIEILMNNLK